MGSSVQLRTRPGQAMADWKRVLSDIPISKPPAYFESLLHN